jgi:hypothetical protein
MNLQERIKTHRRDLEQAATASPFVVFLCGPTLKTDQPKPSSQLRRALSEALVSEGFEVVLGEDDGLEETRLDFGVNAQDNELEFIRRHCNAVIVIADSVGAFCELGLFSWHFVHERGLIKSGTNADFIVLVDEQFERDKSYLNEGPVRAVQGFGQALFVDFGTYDVAGIVQRFKARRGVQTMDRRGRPRGGNR